MRYWDKIIHTHLTSPHTSSIHISSFSLSWCGVVGKEKEKEKEKGKGKE